MAVPRALIALTLLRGASRKSVSRFICKHQRLLCGADQDIVRSLVAESSSEDVRGWRSELDTTFEKADKFIETLRQLEIEPIWVGEEQYPERLRCLARPPALVYVKGNIKALNRFLSIAVIGTRSPTTFGVWYATRLAAVIGETGATVVSGLAIGCDTAAHSGCLSVHGETIAVLAHGLDRVYPAVNRELVGEILDTGGCLLSEYPPKTRPFPANFVERDELQAGLSDGVIVVETGVKGGTMHTVRFSQEQRKPLACVKHPPKLASNPQALGNAMLIEERVAWPISDQSSLEHFWTQVQQSRGKASSEVGNVPHFEWEGTDVQ